MTFRRAYKSDAFEAIHSAVTGMMEAGTIDKQTMRRFDETCLVSPDPMPPEAIKALRERNNVSQPVFARHLNISPSTVQKWKTARTSERPGVEASCDRGETRDRSAGVKMSTHKTGMLT